MITKLNKFTKKVECNHTLFPDIEGLLYGVSDGAMVLFDATAFANKVGVEFSYSQFERACAKDIQIRLAGTDLKMSELFWENPDGHILIHQVLQIVFLKYISPELDLYFDTILETCMRDGLAFSDTLVVQLALTRLSKETLQEIIKSQDGQQQG